MIFDAWILAKTFFWVERSYWIYAEGGHAAPLWSISIGGIVVIGLSSAFGGRISIYIHPYYEEKKSENQTERKVKARRCLFVGTEEIDHIRMSVIKTHWSILSSIISFLTFNTLFTTEQKRTSSHSCHIISSFVFVLNLLNSGCGPRRKCRAVCHPHFKYTIHMMFICIKI